MDIVWADTIDEFNQQRVARLIGCKDKCLLPTFLDDIYSHIEKYLGVTNSNKPTINIVPLISETREWSDKRQTIIERRVGGECLKFKRAIRIGVYDEIGRIIVHEFIHWLKPELKELDVKLTESTLIKYYKWQYSCQSAQNGQIRGVNAKR